MLINDMTVAEVLEKWPETVSVFQELKTACVGCAMAPFDTMADVAQIYEIEISTLMTALQQFIVEDARPPESGNVDQA
jgi:hybrid cluster-associated redox disulfide protein